MMKTWDLKIMGNILTVPVKILDGKEYVVEYKNYFRLVRFANDGIGSSGSTINMKCLGVIESALRRFWSWIRCRSIERVYSQ